MQSHFSMIRFFDLVGDINEFLGQAHVYLQPYIAEVNSILSFLGKMVDLFLFYFCPECVFHQFPINVETSSLFPCYTSIVYFVLDAG